MNEELNSELLFQNFGSGNEPDIDSYLKIAATYAFVENAIAVLSDLRKNKSYIFYGNFAKMVGVDYGGAFRVIDSIWETDILNRMTVSDIRQKELDELQFFDFIRRNNCDVRYYMQNSIAMLGPDNKPVLTHHRIFYFPVAGAIRFALCLYTPAQGEIRSSIIDSASGECVSLEAINSDEILSQREKEVLGLVDKGLSSKEIALVLNISSNTVNRHRQNIIAKLCAKNSSHALRLAKGLNLI